MNMTDRRWKDLWLERKLESSWIANTVDHNLEKYFSTLENIPMHVLEVGCGDGVNSLFLSKQGCTVDAMDISDFALDVAKSSTNKINFICDDFITTDKLVKKYDFIFDKGCFHGTTDPISFARKIASVLTPTGVWFSVIGSMEGRDKNDPFGPPKHTLSDLIIKIEPHLKIISAEATTLVHKKDIHSPAWRIISSNR
jgi:2-polyprenyl-3-methyl-5-hydroxy-6-metoxy-1,4-benzoquinol methylase